MPAHPAGRPAEAPVKVGYAGSDYDLLPSETVLDVLLRHGVDAPYSCRKGSCFSCMLRATSGELPPGAQDGLRDTLREQGYFLACRCMPSADLEVAAPDDSAIYTRAEVAEIERLAPAIVRVRLAPVAPLDYHAGQFVNLRRADGVVRSYSLASVPARDPLLEIHVKRFAGGEMSNWIHDQMRPGDSLDIQGPNGACFYLAGEPDRKMLLVGNGSGLAPLIGIARDALAGGHRGSVHLYHGTRQPSGLYLRETLEAMAARHANFHYHPCLSGHSPEAARAGRAETVALADHPDLKGWRVYLCGHPLMVDGARKAAYLAGAALGDINADAFELRDLRTLPRD